MSDFEKKLGKAEYNAKLKLEQSRKSLREYIEKFANEKYLKTIVLQQIENNDYHDVPLETIRYFRYSIFGKSWMINDYTIFMNDIRKIIGDINNRIRESLAGRAELIYRAYGYRDGNFGIKLKLEINKESNLTFKPDFIAISQAHAKKLEEATEDL